MFMLKFIILLNDLLIKFNKRVILIRMLSVVYDEMNEKMEMDKKYRLINILFVVIPFYFAIVSFL